MAVISKQPMPVSYSKNPLYFEFNLISTNNTILAYIQVFKENIWQDAQSFEIFEQSGSAKINIAEILNILARPKSYLKIDCVIYRLKWAERINNQLESTILWLFTSEFYCIYGNFYNKDYPYIYENYVLGDSPLLESNPFLMERTVNQFDTDYSLKTIVKDSIVELDEHLFFYQKAGVDFNFRLEFKQKDETYDSLNSPFSSSTYGRIGALNVNWYAYFRHPTPNKELTAVDVYVSFGSVVDFKIMTVNYYKVINNGIGILALNQFGGFETFIFKSSKTHTLAFERNIIDSYPVGNYGVKYQGESMKSIEPFRRTVDVVTKQKLMLKPFAVTNAEIQKHIAVLKSEKIWIITGNYSTRRYVPIICTTSEATLQKLIYEPLQEEFEFEIANPL